MAFKEHELNLVLEAKTLLLKDLSKPITVKELQELTKLDPHKLQEIFKHLYKKTIWEYFLFEKMLFATRLLKQTNMPVKEIAAELGYRPQNFTAAFKKYFNGSTPLEYRNGIIKKKLA